MNDFTKGLKKWIGFAAGASVFAAFAVFAAAAWWSLPTVSNGNQVSSSAWNDVVWQINSIAGAVTVDGTHLTGTLPTASNHLATKAYVDASTWGGAYVGKTSTSYLGNLGGILGANSKCQAAFAGSHMCSANEIAKSWSSSMTAWWVRCENITTVSPWMACDGFPSNASVGSFGSADCGGWTYNNTGVSPNWYYGGSFNGSAFVFTNCATSQQIHCCK